MGEDNIVFPDMTYSSPAMEEEMTTIVTNTNTGGKISLTTLVIIILAVVIIVIFLIIILYRKFASKSSKSSSRSPSPAAISLPTLGTQYELASLLSINTVGRENSVHSDDVEDLPDEKVDVFDGRVSRYIDSSIVNVYSDSETGGERDMSVKVNHDEALERALGSNNSFTRQAPPLASEDDFSRPVSMILSTTPGDRSSISIIGDEMNNPTLLKTKVQKSRSRPISRILELEVELDKISEDETLATVTVKVIPPSPSVFKQRPKSELIEASCPPQIPVKKRLPGATSEVNVGRINMMTKPSPKSARSDSHLAIVPPIPPKLKPFLPPKQKINRSKEDLDKLNKEILNKSSSSLVNGTHKLTREDAVQSEETDIDYDIPASEEQLDYDEPVPVLPHGSEEDYDEPVQRYS